MCSLVESHVDQFLGTLVVFAGGLDAVECLANGLGFLDCLEIDPGVADAILFQEQSADLASRLDVVFLEVCPVFVGNILEGGGTDEWQFELQLLLHQHLRIRL